MAIQLLGATRVGDSVASLGPRDRIVLAALCVGPGQPVSPEALADALWGGEAPTTWAKVVQGCVVRLRKALGPEAVETTPAGYRLTLADGQLDTVDFQQHVARGREFLILNEPERAIVELGRALELWKGDPFPALRDWDPARAEVARLREIRLAIDEDMVEAHLAAGRNAEAVALAAPLVAREPFRERRWWLLALAQYRTGRQAEALEVLRSARATLLDELGLDPGSDLVNLEQRILEQDPALAPAASRSSGSRTTCPYRGLRPFDTGDADYYFGRDPVVAEAMRRLADHRLLVVVGPSGCGKSSLVRAGLAPALAREGRLATVVTPGGDPLASLAAAVASLPRRGVLVLDQLEEVFANPGGRTVARELLDELARLVEAGTTVVVTLRADHVGGLAESPGLSALAERSLLLLTPMEEDELREAIEGPARVVGLVLEPGLVDALVREVLQAPGGLPLLSHALAETWERKEGAVLTVAGYRATGGITSAVSQSAERLYESLPADDRDVLRSVVLRLVVPTPAGDPIATRVPTRVLAATPGAPRVLDLLVRSRLVTTTRDTATLAHESVIRAWPRLQTWLDEDIEGQRIFAHLQVAADTWDTLGRPEDELYRGARLVAAREWRMRTNPVLASVEDEFLAAAAAHADAEQLRQARAHAEQVRRNRQLRGALTAAVALLAVSLVAGVLAGVSGRRAQTAADQARAEATRADGAAVDALAARLAATALAQPNLTLSLLLARQAVAVADNPVTEGALLATLANTQGLMGLAHPLHTPDDSTLDHDVTPDGRHLLQQSIDELDLLDTASGTSMYGPLGGGIPPAEDRHIHPAGFIDGGTVAVASRTSIPEGSPSTERRLVVLAMDAGTGAAVGEPQEVPGAIDGRDLLRISPDGQALVSVLAGNVRLWHRQGGQWRGPVSVAIPGLPGPDAEWDRLVRGTFSADGNRAALLFRRHDRDDGRRAAAVIDVRKARLVGPVVLSDSDGSAVVHAVISPDGRRLLVSDESGRVVVRGLGGGQTALGARGSSPATNLAWSPDGTRVALARRDGTTDVYSLHPLRRDTTLPGTGEASALAFVGASGLVRQDGIGTIARFDLAAESPVVTRTPTRRIAQLAAAGGVIAVGRDDGRISLHDSHTLARLDPDLWLGESRGSQAPEGGRVTALAVLPDGSAVIAADRTGRLRMWSVSDRRLIWSLDDVPAAFLAVSPNGRYLAAAGLRPEAAGSEDRAVRSSFTVWDLATQAVVTRDELSDLPYTWDPSTGLSHQLTPTPRGIAFSPDSRRVAVTYVEELVMVYDVEQGERIRWLNTSGSPVSALAFSSDSTTLVGSTPHFLKAWIMPSGRLVSSSWIPRLSDDARMSVSADGRWLVISHPASLTILDRASLRVAVADLPLPSGGGSDDAFTLAATSEDRMAVGSQDSLIALDLDPAHWNARACELAGRRLTQSEWDLFLPATSYDSACE